LRRLHGLKRRRNERRKRRRKRRNNIFEGDYMD
jgi:hypothetical protein